MKFKLQSSLAIAKGTYNRVSSLHMNLQVVNFQRCDCVRMSNHVSSSTCLEYIVKCMHLFTCGYTVL